MLIVQLIIRLGISIIYLIGSWKMFQKAGLPGWAGIIPIYNVYLMVQMAGRPITAWNVIKALLPFFNFGTMKDVAKAYGKSENFGIGLALFPFIFVPIIGFGEAQYMGAPVKA